MVKKRNLVVANWKMNPGSLEEAKKIFNGVRNAAKGLKNTDVVICPPWPFLLPLSKLKRSKNLFWGGQNSGSELKGAFTGEVSAEQVKSVGAGFVIIGHSERRAMGETDEIVKKKLQIAFDVGLTPILCVGEKHRDKEGTHLNLIKSQLKGCLAGLPKKHLVGIRIAYEPVWAIGRSWKDAMSPTDIHETVLFIKKVIGEVFGRDIAGSVRVLYGGSVEPENVTAVMEYGNVSGLLVGHASLKPEEFSTILKAADTKQ